MKNFVLLLIFIFYTTLSFGQKIKDQQKVTTKPFILGEIKEIHSKELSETRILNIYLPDGYSETDSVNYPVIYLLDGSANEDFIHVVGLVQFGNFDWVTMLPKSIVVGIASVDRVRDFTFQTSDNEIKKQFPSSGQSDHFIAFIENELQPFIESNYKTSQVKTLIGQSLGGLFATEVLLKKPTLFNKYIIVSPSIWWDNGSLLSLNSELLNADFVQQTGIYIGVGKEGITPTKTPRVMEVDANLLADKLNSSTSKKVTVFFDYLPLENHATIMHQAVLNAFKLLHN